VVADDETLKLEAPTESVKEQWIETLADLAKRQASFFFFCEFFIHTTHTTKAERMAE